MTKNKLLTLLCPAFFLVFGIYIRVAASSMSKRDAVFPIMVAYLIIAVSIVQIIVDLKKKDLKNPFVNSNLLRVLESIAAMYIYVFLIRKIGFFLDTLWLTFFTMFILEYKNKKVMVISSVIITAVVFGVFKYLLKVPLPTIFI